MADKKVTIGIETTADTSGAKKAEQAITDIGNESKRTEREVNSLEKQSQKLGQELARTGNTSEGVSTKMRGRLTGSIQQAGFQIQDFAVQVGGGTSAMTAFGQQAPQFLGAFGPAGSIAGAIIAIGAVAFNVFSKMGIDAGKTKKALEDMNGAIEQIAKNKVADLNQEFEDTAQAVDLAVKKTLALKAGIEDVIKSENRLALARINSGPGTDEEKAIAREAELKRQATEGEGNRVKNAQDLVQIESVRLKAAEAALQKAQEQLAADRERLRVIRETEDTLKKAAAKKVVITTDEQGIPDIRTIRDLEAKTFAAKKLSDPAFGAEKSAIEGTIAANEARLDGPGSELNKKVAEAEIAYLAARTNVANQVVAAGNNTQAINLDAASVQNTRVNGELSSANQKSSADVNAVVNDVNAALGDVANQPPVKALVERVRGLAADGVQPSEQNEVVSLVQQLIGKIKGKDSEAVKLVERIATVVNTSVDDYIRLSGKVADLERKQKNATLIGGNQNP